jgi:hypothetical protein
MTALRRTLRLALAAPTCLWVVGLTCVVEVCLRVFRVRLTTLCRLMRVTFGGDAGGGPHPGVVGARAQRRLRIADRTFALLPWEVTCLRRALVYGRLVHWVHPTLRIGARFDPQGKLLAHAWLETPWGSLDPGGADFVMLNVGAGAS